jgi:HEAT repeat protein
VAESALTTSSKPLQRTIDALAKSHNEAATPTLVAALAVGSGPVFDGAIAGLCSRRSKVGHLAVLRQWEVLTPAQREMIEKGRQRMGGALREALLEGDDQLFAAARDFVEASGDFDLIPTLVMVAEQPHVSRSRAAIDLTMNLVDQLCKWIAGNREPVIGRDPETIRYCVLESLERSVERFRDHQRDELLEAFVVLAGPHSTLLLSILENPLHPCYKSVIHTLTDSSNANVLRLLIEMLAAKEAAQVVRSVVGKRTDRPFVEALLAMPIDPKNMPQKRNLARIKSIACLESVKILCTEYSSEQQAAAVNLMAATGVSDDHKLDLIEEMLKHGSLAGRIAAAASLRHVPGQRAGSLVLQALKDSDGLVQALAVRQLRERRIPGTLHKLMELVDSPHEEVSAAAREALSEFSFDNFTSRFDLLDEDARRAMGKRVAKVDHTSIERLRQDLASPSRRFRQRALAMATSMGLLPKLADAVIERLQDEDHMIRTAAAEALQFCTAGDVRNALLTAAGADRSVAVQNAAKHSLEVLGIQTAAGAGEAAMVVEGAR